MGNGFGDTLVKSEYDSKDISVYSAIDGTDEGKVKVMVINRSLHEETPVNIALSSDKEYTDAQVYSLYGETSAIQQLQGVDAITGNTFSYTLPALSVTEFIVNTAAPVVETNEATDQEGGINIPLIAGVGAVALICHRKGRKSGK